MQSENEGDRQDALRSAPSEATKKKRQGKGDKEKATRKRQQEGIRVSVVLEPKAGRRPEICLPGTGSVEKPTVAV